LPAEAVARMPRVFSACEACDAHALLMSQFVKRKSLL
jgi:hypothetical protein